MKTLANPKPQRQIRGLLATAGLLHWHPTLTYLLEQYSGMPVDDPQDAPQACLLHLLRSMARLGSTPDDTAFAALLADLEFLYYRVRRLDPSDPDAGEKWRPEKTAFRDWCNGDAHRVVGWHSYQAYPPPDLMVRRLLICSRRTRG